VGNECEAPSEQVSTQALKWLKPGPCTSVLVLPEVVERPALIILFCTLRDATGMNGGFAWVQKIGGDK
jgi:hypothetical protein